MLPIRTHPGFTIPRSENMGPSPKIPSYSHQRCPQTGIFSNHPFYQRIAFMKQTIQRAPPFMKSPMRFFHDFASSQCGDGKAHVCISGSRPSPQRPAPAPRISLPVATEGVTNKRWNIVMV